MFRPKHVVLILGIGIITWLYFSFVIQGQDELLDSLVTTGTDMVLDDWRAVFRWWAEVGVIVAGVAALTWFVVGQWGFSLNRWANADKRYTWWLGLFFLAVVGALPGIVLIPTAQEWGILAKVFFVVNNISVYYLATLLCSAPSYKYIPWGAAVVRRW